MIDKRFLQEIINNCSYHNEYLYHFIENVKEYYPDINSSDLREIVLTIIKILLDKRIIEIYDFVDEVKWDKSSIESIKKVDNVWFEGAQYPDFINMIFFKNQDWFIQKLKEGGYNFKDNWKQFVNSNDWLKSILKV